VTEQTGPAQTPSDKAALFRATFETEHRYVWNSLRRLGVRERDLPDVTHDVFMAFFRALDGFERGRPVKPFLFGIAFRVASDYRRLGRNKNEFLDEPEERRDSTPNAESAVSRSEDRTLVQQALSELEPDRRAVFIMHDIDETSMPEIARALGIPLNTGYSRLRLARQEFKAAVSKAREGRRT